jgi:hypothetical protein
MQICTELRRRLLGDRPTKGTPGDVAEALDVSPLSASETEAFTGEGESTEAELTRTVVVVGLLLKQAEEMQPLLSESGPDLERLKNTWVPHLDRMVQQAIASSLGGDSYQSAKHLAQTKAKFLYPNMKRRAPPTRHGPSAVSLGAAVEPTQAGPDVASRLAKRRVGSTAAERARQARASRRARPKPQWIALAAAAVVLLIAGAMQLRTAPNEDGVLNLPTRAIKSVSPYLESAYRDNNGYGTKFFGTVTAEWDDKGELFQREEAIRIGELLSTTGVEQVMLFDKRRRLRAHYVRGSLVYPRTPEAPSVEFH